jgi:Uma2 family endonuclease
MEKVLSRPQSMLDVYKLLPEGTPIQLINNRLYMSPAPRFIHFETVEAIFGSIKQFVNEHHLGKVAFAPVDVYLGVNNAVQPDVFFIANENAHCIKDDGVHGAPDMIVEVLSPGNKNDDLIKKKHQYEKYGVKEYFIVDADDKTVVTYYLKNNKYVLQKSVKGKLKTKLLNTVFTF